MITASAEPVSFSPASIWRRIVSVRGEMTWVVVGQVAAASGGIVGVRLLTHWLPPEAYGQLALGLTLTTLVQQSILSPFTGAGLRFYAAARNVGELGSFLDALKWGLRLAVMLIIALLLIGILIVSLAQWGGWFEILIWCAALALLSGFSAVLDGMQNAARKRVIVAWHDGLGVWLRFLLGTVVVIVFGARAGNALAGYVLASLIVFCSQYWFFNRSLPSRSNDLPDAEKVAKWRNAIVSYGGPFAVFGVFAWAQSASERWVLQCFSDTVQVAQYAVLFQLGYYPVTMLAGMLMQLLSPMIFQIAGDGRDADRVSQGRRLSVMLSFVVLAATIFSALIAHVAAGTIFSWVVPPIYWPVAHMLPLMVLSGGIFAMGQFASLALMSGSSSMPLIAPKVVTAVLAVGLNVIGAVWGGLRGVAFASLLFSILYTAWILLLASGETANLFSKIWSGVLVRIREAYRIYCLRDPVALATRKWFRENADNSLRLDYPLRETSVVLDLGGYRGDWAAKIHERYNSAIYIFEPVPAFAASIKERFADASNIRIFNYGLGVENSRIPIAFSENSSSTVRIVGSQKIDVEIRDIVGVLGSINAQQIDLIKINIEGGEFALLRRLIDSGLIHQFVDIQVQFHEFVPDAWQLRRSIQADLARTHQLTYDYPFVWENWRRRLNVSGSCVNPNLGKEYTGI